MPTNSREYMQAWYAENRERMIAYRRAYYQRTREHQLAKAKEYSERNPGQRLAANALSHAKRAGALPLRVPPHVMERIASGPCFDCGKTPAGGVDHIIPFCHGGQNVEENLQPACTPCNRKKGRVEQAQKLLGLVPV